MFIFSIIRKIALVALSLFFVSTLFVVLLFRFVPVPVTPLMVIRMVQQVSDGQMPRLKHHWVPLDSMSRYMPVAVIASEDQRFLSHNGFDFKEIGNALSENMNGKRKRGASTISQQTAKNVFLWPGRTWVRKGLEAYFTSLIEIMWSKQRIMEVYLNSIEMGDGIYGADAVAEYPFDREAKDLTRAQCALVAATLPNPRKFSSANPSPYMLKRQRQIMRQMRFIPAFPKEGHDK